MKFRLSIGNDLGDRYFWIYESIDLDWAKLNVDLDNNNINKIYLAISTFIAGKKGALVIVDQWVLLSAIERDFDNDIECRLRQVSYVKYIHKHRSPFDAYTHTHTAVNFIHFIWLSL